MRQLGIEFEKHYNSSNIPISDQFEPNEINCKDLFNAITIELFELKKQADPENEVDSKHNTNDNLTIEKYYFNCNWGRIIGLYSIVGCLAIKCYEKSMTNLIYQLINLLVDFLNNDKRIYSWISCSGGWVGLFNLPFYYLNNFTSFKGL